MAPLLTRYKFIACRGKNVNQTSPDKSRIAKPEVWFRVTYVVIDPARKTASPFVPYAVEVAEYREQTVEVALGPHGAFENGNIGRLTRQLPLDPIIDGGPTRIRNARSPAQSGERRIPHVVELLRKAFAWRKELNSGVVARQADIARREGVTRARVTQVLMLLRLAPDIQESILGLAQHPDPPRLPERVLRPIARMEDPERQVEAFEAATRRHP